MAIQFLGGTMKTLFIMIALTLPSLSSAAEYLDVECYIAEGTTVTKTFDGYVFGTVKTVGNRVIVEGKNIEPSYVHRRGTPDTCKSPTGTSYDNDGYSSSYNVSNVYVLEFDYATVELSCAAGSVVKKFGNLANFTKAIEGWAKRNTQIDSKPICLDLTNLE